VNRPSGAHPEAVRFVAGRARLAQARPSVLFGALAVRAGLLRAYVAWPAAASPLFLLPAGDTRVAAWVRRTFEPWAERRVSAVTWNALRAGTLVLPRSPGLAVAAAERGLGRPLRRPAIGCVSASGHPHSKLLCFVFEADEPEPVAVVKGIPSRGEGARLVRESERVQEVRARLIDAPDAVRGLPPAPLWSGSVADDELTLEPVDDLAAATGVEDREAALDWLASLQRATSRGAGEPWGGDSELAVLRDWISFAWARLRPASLLAVLRR
jgi:hypothetical protein